MTTELPPEESPVFRVRTDEVLVEVRGDDAASWLQGQLTNDVRAATKDAAILALVVDVKGKVVGDLWTLRTGDDGFLLAVGGGHVDDVVERLDVFVIMEDVELRRRPDLSLVSVVGPAPVPLGASGGLRFSSERFPGETGSEWVVPTDGLPGLVAALRPVARELDEAGWEAHRISRGAPRFGVDFDHRHFPQEAGLRDRAVSFDKGCYLGQEVVCMLEMRGKLKRRLARIEGPTDPGAPGQEVCDEDGKVVGVVGSSAGTRDGFWQAFAMLPVERAAPGGAVRVREADFRVVG